GGEQLSGRSRELRVHSQSLCIRGGIRLSCYRAIIFCFFARPKSIEPGIKALSHWLFGPIRLFWFKRAESVGRAAPVFRVCRLPLRESSTRSYHPCATTK